MNWIDICLVLVTVSAIWSGYRNGFILEFSGLFTWLVSLCSALYFYQFLSLGLLKIFTKLGAWANPLSFLLILMITRIVIQYIFRRALLNIPGKTQRSNINHIAGMLPGTGNGLIWATIIAAMLLAIPLSDGITRQARNSRIAAHLSTYVEWLDEKLSPVFDEAVARTMNKLTIDPATTKTVNLPFKVSNASARPDLEAEMLALLNKERIKRNLEPLQPDTALRSVARKHDADMFARGYFSHITPEGKTPGDRIRAAHIPFLVAGENLALGQTVRICHNGLMESPGQRANILHKAYGKVGIGILDGGIHGLMITQQFKN